LDVSFGPYRLVSQRRLLLEGDKPVRLGSRAFDILIALVERAGEVVSKEELIARAWPATSVDETNLKIQVSALRRALGDGQGDNRFIATVIGRGYNFVAPIREEEPSPASPSLAIVPMAPHNLPFATTRMIGREDIVTTIVAQLSHQRLVAVVGPGGVGKTTVGLAVAERLIGVYERGVWLVDLAPLHDPGLVPSAVATVLGLEIRTEDPLPGLVAAIGDRRLLLLLDNCEHVIDAAAGLAAAVLSGTPNVSILATSREPLGVPGERVHRLEPLGTPEPSPGLTAADAYAFPAVQLFVERVTAIVEDFALTDANASLVVAICRRLDGLPLAIEFAAPRVEVLGVEGLAARLDDCLRRLSGARRRTAVPRHRTMQAVVDWSYGLLDEHEQKFFRALGIFAGRFTVEAAEAVAADTAATGTDAIDQLADLVAKSLVAADASGARPWFRLLGTTRAYALEKLEESGEREVLEYRHAEHYSRFFARAETEYESLPTTEWLADYACQIDNLRAALKWAFSPGGDNLLGVALTTVSVPIWLQLSLMEECRSRVERALDAVADGAHAEASTVMKLHAALAISVTATRGMVAETDAIWTKALQLAEALNDGEYRLRALWGLWMFHSGTGRHVIGLELARRFGTLAIARPQSNDRLVGERMVAASLHYLGDHAGAWRHLEQVMAGGADRGSSAIRFQFDLRASARAYQARILWMRGYPDQAMRAAATSVEDARATQHAMSVCYALAHAACPIALWIGDDAEADKHIAMLTDQGTSHALPAWRALGRCHAGVLAQNRGDFSASARILREGLSTLREVLPGLYYVMLEASLALSLGRNGQIAEGLARIDEVIARTEVTEEHWMTAELLRVRGELLLLNNPAAAAEDVFHRALEWARGQGARSWELRAATSLARLQRSRGRSADAVALLRPVYERFTEGFGTRDLIAAKQLLDDLAALDLAGTVPWSG
jgi:predicted ATPase/DNA-binding winged helix-turn-helix (wHTH) protein